MKTIFTYCRGAPQPEGVRTPVILQIVADTSRRLIETKVSLIFLLSLSCDCGRGCGCGLRCGLGPGGTLEGQRPRFLEELGHADAGDIVRSRTISMHRYITGRAGDPAHLLLQGSIAARADAAGLVLIHLGDGNAKCRQLSGTMKVREREIVSVSYQKVDCRSSQ